MPNTPKPDQKKEEREVVFHIDKTQHKEMPPITGDRLYSLATLGAGYELYLESRGKEDDLPIKNDATEVPLRNGDKVYSAQSTLNPGADS